MGRAQRQRADLPAEELYRLRTEKACKSAQTTAFTRLYEAVIRYEKKYAYEFRLNADEIRQITNDAILYQFPPDDLSRGWSPEKGPFTACYLQKLRWLCIERVNEKKKKPGLDIPVTSGGEDEQPIEIPGGERADARAQAALLMARFLRLLCDEIKVKIKGSPNKFCYTQRFFTEWIARQILEPVIPDVTAMLPGTVGSCMDMKFASCFLDGTVETPADIAERSLKKLSAFTGKAEDADTPCGFDLNNAVYVQYVSAETGRSIYGSIVSNNRKKFLELLEKQSRAIGIGNHPFTES